MEREMKTYGIVILGITYICSESRWKGMGSMRLPSGEWIVHVGQDDHLQGMAIMMSQRAKKVLIEWKPVYKENDKGKILLQEQKSDCHPGVLTNK